MMRGEHLVSRRRSRSGSRTGRSSEFGKGLKSLRRNVNTVGRFTVMWLEGAAARPWYVRLWRRLRNRAYRRTWSAVARNGSHQNQQLRTK